MLSSSIVCCECRKVIILRFTITLPDSVAEKLSADVTDQDSPRSTLIARYIEEHYEAAGQPVVDCEAELQKLKTKHEDEVRQINEAHEAEHKKLRESYADIMQRAREEHEKRGQQITVEHDEKVRQIADERKAEVQQIRAECEKRAEEAKQLEDDVERLEGITNKLDNELKASQTSKSVVVTGMQHEIELMQQKVSSLEDTLHLEREHLSELRRDKEDCKKQLELVTLRLPPPKVGFWARLFGKKKE